MEFDLATILKLQQIDLSINDCLRKEEELPRRILTLEDEIASRQKEMELEKGKLTELLKSKKEAEAEVELMRGKIAHYKDQLLSVKTNKEYAALLKEIDAAQKKVDGIEERIIGFLIEVDEHNAHIKKIESWFQSEKSKLLAEKATLESELAQTRVARSGFESKRVEVEAILPETVRHTYSRVRALRGGALAEARDEFCMECHVRLRPQVYNDIRNNNQLITCDSCYRILYYDGPPPLSISDESPESNEPD